MVKWKKLNKKLVVLLTAAMMLFGSQATAFAYVDQGTEAVQEKSTTETEEPVVEDTHTEENRDPFSVPGNGEVRDDITDDSSKEFLTIKTKNNNTFYIVIDRAATTNNVYMLSQIDENDLKEFLDEDQQQTLETAVSEGSNEVGIVYATDADSVADKVDVIATANDTELKSKVIYPVGLVKNTEADDAEVAAAKAFVDYLKTPEAAAVFEKYGFSCIN